MRSASSAGTARASASIRSSRIWRAALAAEASASSRWSSEGTTRSYALIGGVRDDIEAEWDVGVPVISISRYVLGVLTITDGEGWYIAGEAELRAEAGLAAE